VLHPPPQSQVDILNTEAHNSQLSEAQSLLESELSDKEAAIAKYESSMKKRADEIERKTREIDTLNRKLERIIAARPGRCRRGCGGVGMLACGGRWRDTRATSPCHTRTL
jgi:septal ring factor EnvC (AmiA/AmiB activator)